MARLGNLCLTIGMKGPEHTDIFMRALSSLYLESTQLESEIVREGMMILRPTPGPEDPTEHPVVYCVERLVVTR